MKSNGNNTSVEVAKRVKDWILAVTWACLIAACLLNVPYTRPVSTFKAGPTLQEPTDAEIAFQQCVKKFINDTEKIVESWKLQADILLGLTILVGIFGVITGALQKYDKGWCKIATV